MIKNAGLYFESEDKSDFWGIVTRGIHIYYGGRTTVLTRRGSRADSINEYKSTQEFISANPIIAKEIINWCRANRMNLDNMIEGDGSDIIPITKICKKCGKEKGIGEFPRNDLAFDGAHDDCCECRISECKKIRAYCATAGQERCRACPVRTPMGVVRL